MTLQHVLVLGGAGLIGRQISIDLALAGYIPVIVDSDKEKTLSVQQIIASKDCHSLSFSANILDELSFSSTLLNIENTCGQLVGAINATYPRGPGYGNFFENIEYNELCNNVSMQIGGAFLAYKLLSSHFLKYGAGSFVSLGSIYGSLCPRFSIYDGTSMTTPLEYVIAKSSLLQMSRYYASAYKKKGIRFNVVSPGGIFDNQPQSFVDAYNSYAGAKGMLSPSDITGAVIFLISDKSNHITGQDIIVDDGFSF